MLTPHSSTGTETISLAGSKALVLPAQAATPPTSVTLGLAHELVEAVNVGGHFVIKGPDADAANDIRNASGPEVKVGGCKEIAEAKNFAE